MVSAFKSSFTIMWPFLSFNLLRFSSFPYSYSKYVSLKNTSVTIIFFTFVPNNISHILSCFLVLSILSITRFRLRSDTFKSDDILYLCPFRFFFIHIYCCVRFIFILFIYLFIFVFSSAVGVWVFSSCFLLWVLTVSCISFSFDSFRFVSHFLILNEE